MAKRVPRASVPSSNRNPVVPSIVSDNAGETEEIVIKLLHTADWHLGRRFPSFPEEAQKKLSRARMDVVGKILDLARRNAVNAVLCAGDLFDEPTPAPDFWRGLAAIFRNPTGFHPPVFLVPGNHDPLTSESVWAPSHPFRKELPDWVHVVDEDNFTFELAPDAVLYASPCRSKAGENDLAMALPTREPGDTRVRIGCVHGSTFDIDGYQTNFPIGRDAGVLRGLNYLAIGDTHSFRDVTESSPVPTVYPGAPEPTNFDEPGAGSVALVLLFRHGSRRPRIERSERVGFWQWIDRRCRSINDLRTLLTTPDLDRHVVRLHLDMTVSVAEESEIERILCELQGTDATHGRAGILLVDRTNLILQPGSAGVFPEDLPPVIKDTIARLDALTASASDDIEKARATRALAHLYKLLQTQQQLGRAI
jgi:DNA repair exonuclease SbcCD nuclease subunit